MFLDALDTSLVGVALPSIQNELGLSNATLQWLVSGYTVTYGGLLLFGGRVADLFGRRRVFLASMVLFAVASLVGGLVSSGELLIISRVVKGIAAAFTAPAAMSIITTTFHEGSERNRALGFYSATAAGGYSLGLILSGILTEANWRLVFFMPVAVALLVIVATPLTIRADQPESRQRRSYDITGAMTITGSVLLLIFGLVQAPEVGWGAASTLGALGAAVVLFAIFIAVERRHSDPTVPLRLFRSWTRSSASILAVLFAAASLGWQFVATLYIQQLLGYGPFQTAMVLLPVGISTPPIALVVTPWLLNRIPMHWVAGIGMLFQGAGIVMFVFVGLESNYLGLMLPGMLLHGIGNGLVFPTMTIAGVQGVDDRQQGVASGVITGSYQLGVGLGVAIMASVITATVVGSGEGAQLAGYQTAFMTASVIALLGLLVGFIGLQIRRGTPADAPTAPAEPAGSADATPPTAATAPQQ
ncbi:MFS transporter [Allonocardiopsis opalescens]|nr:MFS transporter [Allonocardiopsis opalescens]